MNSEVQQIFESQSESGSGIRPRPRPRPLLTLSPQYSLDEILAKTLSLINESSIFFILVVYALDPSRPQHLYSFLPSEYKNNYSFCGLLAVEAVFVMMIVNFSSFSLVCQLLFFGKCQLEFQRLNLQLRLKKSLAFTIFFI